MLVYRILTPHSTDIQVSMKMVNPCENPCEYPATLFTDTQHGLGHRVWPDLCIWEGTHAPFCGHHPRVDIMVIALCVILLNINHCVNDVYEKHFTFPRATHNSESSLPTNSFYTRTFIAKGGA